MPRLIDPLETGFNIVTGEPVEQIAEDVLISGKASDHNATLLNKTVEANELFLEERDKRYAQTVDEEGNPLHEELPRDIKRIGGEVRDAVGSSIRDPDVSDAFHTEFNEYIELQELSSIKVAQEQQVEFGISTLNNDLTNLVDQAAKDDIDQVENYRKQGINALQNATLSQLITTDDYERIATEFSNQIKVESIRATIQTDKHRASEILSLTSDQIGITEKSHKELQESLQATINSDEAELQKATEHRQIDDSSVQVQQIESLETQLEAGTLREDTLVNAKDQLESKVFNRLQKQLKDSETKQKQERDKNSDILKRIESDQFMGTVSQSQVNKLYDYVSEQLADSLGRSPTLTEEAQLVAGIPTKISKYAKKLDHSAKFSDLDKADDILSAYSYIKDRKKPTLDSGFGRDSTAIMEHADLLVNRAGLSSREALTQARDTVLHGDEKTQKFRRAEFKKEDAFKDVNIEETAADELGAETFFGTNILDTETVLAFRQLTESAFQQTGDIDSAVAVAREQMSRTHGISEVSANSQYMLLPPEKAFPGVESDTLRNILVREVTSLLPTGIDPNTISISSDDITRGQVAVTGTQDGQQVSQAVPTWSVTYTKNIDGIPTELPLLDPKTGQVQRWTPMGAEELQ